MPRPAVALSGACDLRDTHSGIIHLSHKAVLEIVLRELEQRSAIREALELHPLGFARVSFAEHRLADGYHLHMWNGSEARDHAELPHAHAFDMQSRVLAGSLEQQVWDAVEDPKGDYVRIPVDSMASTSHFMHEVARPVTLQSRSSRKVVAGEHYGMSDELHTTVIPPGTNTVTLIHKHYPGDRKASVILPNGIRPGSDDFDHQCPDPDAILKHVRYLLEQQLSHTV